MDILNSGWRGHYCFAYDLVRNIKPAKIVELGTQRGHSFFSFCQAVKDGFLNTKLFAVDTWEGDKHTGSYDESAWISVNSVKDKYFGGLPINFLKKTFDEATGDFKKESIDILHIDGYHTYEAVKNDFERWFGKVSDNGIILFHDIVLKNDDFGVYQLWRELKKNYKTFEFYHSNGLGVLFKGCRSLAEVFEYPYLVRQYYNVASASKLYPGRDSNLMKKVTERDEQIAALYGSTSWRITRTLRMIGQGLKRFKEMVKLKKQT